METVRIFPETLAWGHQAEKERAIGANFGVVQVFLFNIARRSLTTFSRRTFKG